MSKQSAFVILAAGMGTRLGGFIPKPLTRLSDGRTIMEQQLQNIAAVFGEEAWKRTFVVVGHKAELIVESLPSSVRVIYNEDYDRTNTSKSLLRALELTKKYNGVMWFNGDVVFSPYILSRAIELMNNQCSFLAVTNDSVGEEEMKYSLSTDGSINRVSKQNSAGLGEAVGINFVAASDIGGYINALRKVSNDAYFEAAIEETIRKEMIWMPLPVSGLFAVEIDFQEDLQRVNSMLDDSSKAPLATRLN